MRFTDGSAWWQYRFRSHPNYAVGTSLCYRKDWWMKNPFQAIQVDEDNRFVQAAVDARQLVSAEGGDLMFATVHPGNTSPRKLDGSSWTPIEAPGMHVFGVAA